MSVINRVQLENMSIDATAWEKYWEGAANEDVVTRFQKVYPTHAKALKILAETGGFKPFLTEAERAAYVSELPRFIAKVRETSKIWWYENGVWFDTGLSELDQSKEFTYHAISQVIATEVKSLQNFNLKQDLNKQSIFFEYDGTEKQADVVRTTDFIPVTESDAWNLTCLLEKMGDGVVTFSFFDANKNFHSMKGCEYNRVGSIVSQDVAETQFIEKSNHLSVFAPISGFLRVTYYVQYEPALFLNKVSTEMALELRRKSNGLQAYALDSFKQLKGKLRTLTINPAISSGLYYRNQVVGDALHFNTVADLSYIYGLTNYIPVRKGQYLHTCLPVDELGYPIYYVGANKGFIRTIGNDYLLNNPNTFSSLANINLKLEQDGFITFNMHKLIDVGGFYAITDNPIEQHNPEYLTNTSKLNFYDISHSPAGTTVTDLLFYSGLNIDNKSMPLYLGIHPSSDQYMTKPLWLRKGDILEFTNTTNKPTIGIFFKELITVEPENIALGIPEKTTTSIMRQTWIDPAKVTLQGWLDWKAVDPTESAMPMVLNDGVKSTSHYCDFENDTMLMLYIPSSSTDNFRDRKFSLENSFRILSKAEYIEYRNNNFESLTPLCKINRGSSEVAAYIDRDMEWFKPVLTFKDEIFTGISNAANLRLFFNKWKIDEKHRGMFTNETHTNLTVKPPIDLDIDNQHSYRTNTMLFDTDMSIGMGLYYLKAKADGTFSADSTYVDLQKIRENMRVINRHEYILGQNVKTNLIPTGGVSVPNMQTVGKYVKGGFLLFLYLGSYDTMSAIVLKGKRYKFKSFGTISDIIFVPYDSIKNQYAYALIPNALTVGDLYQPWGSRRNIAIEQYFSPEEDGVVYLNSETANRVNADSSLNIPRIFSGDTTTGASNLVAMQYQLEIVEVTEAEYLANTTIFKGTSLRVPVDNALTIKFLSGISGDYLFGEMKSIVQICHAGKAIATLNCATANQGQSTAYAYKRNINLEFFNDKWENVYISFGDNFEETEIVLKSNSGTDLAQVRDAVGAEIWRKLRRDRPFGENFIVPSSLFYNRAEPTNAKSQCSTFGFPVEAYVGDTFIGVYTIRNKIKRGNWAMKKKEKKHILIQPDWQFNGLLNWFDARLKYFEVRTPEVIGYVPGDDALPVGNDTLAGYLSNFLTWSKGVVSGTIDFKSTYAAHINLDSFIDYILQIEVIGNRDSVTNNFVAGTWDGTIWSVFPYDMDSVLGLGWMGEPETSPYFTLPNLLAAGSSTLFYVIYQNYKDLIDKRYLEVRKNNTISPNGVMGMVQELNQRISTYSYTKDFKMFDIVPKSYQEMPQTLGWIYKRLRFTDATHGYLPSDSVALIAYNPPTLLANASNIFTVNADVKVGDVLKYEFGGDLQSTTITLSVITNGQIKVEHKNPTATAVNPTSLTYLRIYK